jgi:hypothetical protein
VTATPAALRIALIVAALALVPAAHAQQAGKPGPGGGGDITFRLVPLDSSDGVPHHGQRVTFDVVATATDRPMVSLKCFQGGTLVYAFQAGFYPDYPWTKVATLRSNSWTGGGADCDARLYKAAGGSKTTTLATLSFRVYA